MLIKKMRNVPMALAIALVGSIVVASSTHAAVMVEEQVGFGAFNYNGGTESITLKAATNSALIVTMSHRFDPSTSVVFDPSGANASMSLLQSNYSAQTSTDIFVLPIGDVTAGSFDITIADGNRTLGNIYQISGADQDTANWLHTGDSKADEGNLSLLPGSADAGSLLIALGSWAKVKDGDTRALSGTADGSPIAFNIDRNAATNSNNGLLLGHASVEGSLDLDFDTSIVDSQDAMAFSVAVIPEAALTTTAVPEPATAGLALLGMLAFGLRRHHA